jgi:hypothetical protein
LLPFTTTYYEWIGTIPAGATQIPGQTFDDVWWDTPSSVGVGTPFSIYGNIQVPVGITVNQVKMCGEVRGFELTPALQSLFNTTAWQAGQWFRGAGSMNQPGSAAPSMTSGSLHGSKTAPTGWQTDWVAAETLPGTSTFAFQQETAVSQNGNTPVVNSNERRANRITIWYP